MAAVELTVNCVSKELCQNCRFIDLEVNHYDLFPDFGNRNEIRCSKYDQCSKMLKYLNLNGGSDHETDE